MNQRIKKMLALMLTFVLTFLSMGDITGNNTAYAAENSVTLHFKTDWGGADIFYWSQDGKYDKNVRWTGKSMSTEKNEKDWYKYTFDNTSEVEFMFNYRGKQTTYFTKTTGEYWYAGDTWYDHKPDEAEITPTNTPVPTNTPRPVTATPTPTPQNTATPTVTKKPTATSAPTNTPKPTESLEDPWHGIRPEAPTQAPEVTIKPSTSSIILHCYSAEEAVNVYYWNVNKGKNTPVTWPGKAMEVQGNGWYTYTIANASYASIVFTTATKETDEFSNVKAGEFWYCNGVLSDENPNGDVTPMPTNPQATATPTVTEAPSEAPTPTQVLVTPTVTEVPTPTRLVVTPTVTEAPTPTQAEATATPRPEVKGKIIAHVKSSGSTPTVYYWNRNGDESDKPVQWPGMEMEKDAKDGWYVYTIEECTSSKIIFVINGGQTDDLEQKEGEWWYQDGKWYDMDPEGPTPTPGPTNTPRPTNTPTPTRDPNLPTPTPSASGDFRDETIYFVITTRFYDGDPSNNVYTSGDYEAGNDKVNDPSWRGDFKGLIEKLDYIKALGFTAVWITPVVENKSAYDYHGYHGYNFTRIDSRYESDGVSYQDVVDAVHAKGMKLIQDIVLNHCSQFGEENLLQVQGNNIKERNQIIMNGKGDYEGDDAIFHHNGYTDAGGYDNYDRQISTMADDCFDLETENPTVYNYLIDCYKKIIATGIDGFRIDTVAHISRLNLNSTFLPAFREAGGENFFMFGEVCTKGENVWYRDHPGISTCFYTWKEDSQWANKWTTSTLANEALVAQHFKDHDNMNNQPTSDNAFLKGNEYHTPDYSQSSGLASIDFQMHWAFKNASNAFSMARKEDAYFNDSTYNVMYVDSHDYGPDGMYDMRYPAGTDAWAENLSLMFTFRGIPCLYYGSEIEFMKGAPIDKGTKALLSQTGRAYYGDHLEGTVTATDFGDYTATGEVATTLNQPLCKHLRRLNKIRAAIPALRKGQYSTENVSGDMAYKRRYTNAEEGVDSFVCVAVTNGATFSNLPGGTYVDAVTGDTQVVAEGGTLTATCSGQGNLRVYVLDTPQTPAPGQVGADIDDPFMK